MRRYSNGLLRDTNTRAHLSSSQADCERSAGDLRPWGQGRTCPVIWDGWLCWPRTLAGATIKQPCPAIFQFNTQQVGSVCGEGGGREEEGRDCGEGEGGGEGGDGGDGVCGGGEGEMREGGRGLWGDGEGGVMEREGVGEGGRGLWGWGRREEEGGGLRGISGLRFVGDKDLPTMCRSMVGSQFPLK